MKAGAIRLFYFCSVSELKGRMMVILLKGNLGITGMHTTLLLFIFISSYSPKMLHGYDINR